MMGYDNFMSTCGNIAVVICFLVLMNLGCKPEGLNGSSAGPSETSANTLYASPSGHATGMGTLVDPLDLSTGLSRMSPDTVLELLGGIYRTPSIGLTRDQWLLVLGNDRATARAVALGGKKSIIRATSGARVIITRDSGLPPPVLALPYLHVEGIWFGGNKDTADNPVQGQHDVEIVGCVFFDYYGGIVDGGVSHNLYQGNLFVNCGTGEFYHSIYISGQPDSTRGCTVQGNVFVGGGGYHIQLWHQPTYTQVLNNFSGDAWYSLVVDGNGILARDNILWSNRKAPILYQGDNTNTIRFIHNLFGKKITSYKWNAYPGDVADSNNFLSDATQYPFGTNQRMWPSAQCPTYLGASANKIDTAIVRIEEAFDKPLSVIQTDDSLPQLWITLQSVLGSWSGAKKITVVEHTMTSAPSGFQLRQNFPNPFNPSTTITIDIPSREQVDLRVYDLLGREVSVLLAGELSPGEYTVEWNASSYAGGVYFCRLQTSHFDATRRMVLLK